MLRHLEINNQLCIQDENHELFLKHDIKGNQYDTLAYLFYKEHNKGLLAKDVTDLNGPGLNFYRECEKEAVESFKNCCKHGNMRVLWEFYLYERLCANSSNRVVIDQTLADQLLHTYDKKGAATDSSVINAEWLLELNYEKLFKRGYKLAFNTDLVQIQFQAYFTRTVFNFDLVGPAKDIHLLKAKCLLDRTMTKLILQKTKDLDKDTLTQIRDEISRIVPENIRSFDDYFVYRRVNNPLLNTDLAQRKTYGNELLNSHFETMKLGLGVFLEFVSFSLPLFSEAGDKSQIEQSVLKTEVLERAKAAISGSIKALLICGQPALSSQNFFTVSHLLRTIFTVVSVFSRIGQDLKTNLKQFTKSKSEAEKELISKCLSQYSSLKDYFKEAAKAVEDHLQSCVQTKQHELKETILGEFGLAWPAIIRDNTQRLTSHYNSMLHNAILELQTRLSMMRKAIN